MVFNKHKFNMVNDVENDFIIMRTIGRHFGVIDCRNLDSLHVKIGKF